MNVDFTLLAIIAFSTLSLLFSKTHVAFVTLALCSGAVLADSVADSLAGFFRLGNSADLVTLTSAISIVLILFPPLIICYRFRKSQKGGIRFIGQFVPALGVSLLAAVLVINALPGKIYDNLASQAYLAGSLNLFEPWIVVFAIFTALFDVLIQHAGPPRDYKKRKK